MQLVAVDAVCASSASTFVAAKSHVQPSSRATSKQCMASAGACASPPGCCRHSASLFAVPQVLRLENNRLECLPDNFGELHSLIKLDVSTNCLRQLPASMGRLKRIQRVDAANNLLTRVPPSMGHLKSLKEFNLKYNSLDDRYKAKTEEGLSRWGQIKHLAKHTVLPACVKQHMDCHSTLPGILPTAS